MPEENEGPGRFARIKQHVKDNKKVYLVGGGCLVAGYFLRRPKVITTITPSITPVINNMPVFNNDNSSMINFGGPTTKVVKCLETGEIWEKVTEAANAANVTVPKMSQHLNGHKAHVNELHYKIIGLGTVD